LREADAIAEKVRGLEILFNNRISILTGGAGTGKTSVLRVFLEELSEAPSTPVAPGPKYARFA